MKNKSYSKKTFSRVSGLIELRNKYPNNPVKSYLNVNPLRNKIIGLREIMSKAPPDLVCIDKTKLNESFADFQFYMENYQSHHHAPTLTYPPPPPPSQPPFWRNRNSKGGGKLVFVKNSI